MAGTGVLLEAGVLFTAAAIAGALAWRLGQSVIPAYILAGVLLGPNAPVPALRVVETSEFVTLLQELGVVLLLFFIGLHFSPSSLLERRRSVFRAGLLDLGLNATVGLVAGLLLGFTLLEAVVLAGVTYISSSAIITKSLIERGWIADPEAESILGVLVFEDLVIAVYLAVVAAVVLSGEGLGATATAVGISVGFVGLLALLAFYGTGLVERALDVRSDELFLLRIVGGAALLGGVALALGVSEAVAAFFLGAAVGGTEHAGRVERVITSERDLYAAVFFFAIGLGTDPATFGAVALPVLVLAAVSTASKLASGYLGGRAYGLSERRSVRMAVAMVARGEFSLVLAALAVQAEMDPALAALAVGYVLVMSVLGTTLMGQSARVEALARRVGLGEPPPSGGDRAAP
ncbi:MAG: cation:proton antiporter [Haloarculaceae archaeon]